MSTPVEIIIQMMSAMTATELCTVMKAGADLLTKGAKSSASKGSRATGVVPPQLAKNKEWVDIVFVNAKENGWETFDAKNGDEIVEMEASVETEEGPRFEDGSEFTMKDAMSLAKHLKDSESELWVAFSESYDEDHPKEASASAAPVRRTRAEISAAAEERKARLEAEKEERAAKRAEEKALRDAKKAEEAEARAIAKAEREAKAAAAKAEKEAAKSAKLPAAVSAATSARLAALITKVKPTAVATAAVSEPAKKVAVLPWKVPADGAFKLFPHKGKVYMANNKYHVYTKGAVQGERGDWVGQYIPSENRIDDEVEEPVDEDAE
uniref:Uncharacterized protein n=1 Tax=viral metagenome TaxID=1070528 RepID=A0A6C0KU53_9ZZZZ